MTAEKRKLCIVSPAHWSAGMGGAEYQMKLLLEYLVAHTAWDITYLTAAAAPSHSPDGYCIIKIRGFQKLRKYSGLMDAPGVYGALARIRPDVIYQRVGGAFTGAAGLYARIQKIPLVWHASHDDDVTPLRTVKGVKGLVLGLEKRFLEYGIRQATRIITQTRDQQRLLKTHYPFLPTATLVRNFHPMPSEAESKKGPIKVLWVANFKRWKRPEVFIDLARALSMDKTEVQWLMAGRFYDATAAWERQLLDRIAHTPNLSYLGELSQDEVNRVMSQSHIFVNTSIAEGFPNTFIQAAMRKLPILSMNANPDDILHRYKMGWECRYFSVLAEKTKLLIRDEVLWQQYGDNAHQYANCFHSKRNINSIYNAIRTEFESPKFSGSQDRSGQRANL